MSKARWTFISIVLDTVLINVSIILAFFLRFGGELPVFNFQAYTNLAVFITLIQLAAFYIYDLYEIEKTRSSWEIFYAVIRAVSLGVILVVAFTFFIRFFSFPRTVFVLSWFLLVFSICGWRIAGAKFLPIKLPGQRVLVVGTNEAAIEIANELKDRSEWGFELVGLVSRRPAELGKEIGGFKIMGGVKDIVELVKRNKIDRVIVASPVGHRELLEDMARSEKVSVKVEVIPELYEIFIGKVDHTLVRDIPLVELTREPFPDWIHLVKRMTDIILAFLGILLTFPVAIGVAVLIKLTSPGPVLYKQERVGENERIFWFYKFRTMIEGAEEKSGPVMAVEKDPRSTPIGRFLRRYRIDEIPQFYNVLKGDMSFVGPRAERPYFVEKFKKTIPGYSERFKVKPGLTGLAQVSGSYATSARNKLKYDLIYIYNQSLFLDIKILLQTLKVVLTGRGAR